MALLKSFDVFSQLPSSPTHATKLIGTHNGSFHCDECLACGLLQLTKEFEGANVLRTRNPDFLSQCNVVVDVGGVYDPSKYLFDHHQPSFHGTMTTSETEYKTRLSSAGLVYKHFGKEIVRRLVGSAVGDGDFEAIYDRVYKSFVESVDGNDNGVEEFALSRTDTDVELVQNYVVTTSLPSRVKRFAPEWNAPSSAPMENEGFKKGVQLATEEFVECVKHYVESWLPARSIVRQMLTDRFQVHESGRICKLEGFCPWKDHLFDLETVLGIEGQVLYVLFPDGAGGQWRVQCVGVKGTKFQNRKPLAWKGLRDDELSKASGIPGGVFVHVSGFIGGNKSYAGALAMAVKSMEA